MIYDTRQHTEAQTQESTTLSPAKPCLDLRRVCEPCCMPTFHIEDGIFTIFGFTWQFIELTVPPSHRCQHPHLHPPPHPHPYSRTLKKKKRKEKSVARRDRAVRDIRRYTFNYTIKLMCADPHRWVSRASSLGKISYMTIIFLRFMYESVVHLYRRYTVESIVHCVYGHVNSFGNLDLSAFPTQCMHWYVGFLHYRIPIWKHGEYP